MTSPSLGVLFSYGDALSLLTFYDRIQSARIHLAERTIVLLAFTPPGSHPVVGIFLPVYRHHDTVDQAPRPLSRSPIGSLHTSPHRILILLRMQKPLPGLLDGFPLVGIIHAEFATCKPKMHAIAVAISCTALVKCRLNVRLFALHALREGQSFLSGHGSLLRRWPARAEDARVSVRSTFSHYDCRDR